MVSSPDQIRTPFSSSFLFQEAYEVPTLMQFVNTHHSEDRLQIYLYINIADLQLSDRIINAMQIGDNRIIWLMCAINTNVLELCQAG